MLFLRNLLLVQVALHYGKETIEQGQDSDNCPLEQYINYVLQYSLN